MRKTKKDTSITIVVDAIFGELKAAMDVWEPVGKERIRVEITTEKGSKVEISKDRKTVEEAKKAHQSGAGN